MPNDIDEFLRRAAERRQSKSTVQGNAAIPTAMPVYPQSRPLTNAPDRNPRNTVEEEVPLQAILIDDNEVVQRGVADHMKSVQQRRLSAENASVARRAAKSMKKTESAVTPLISGAERAPSTAPQTKHGDDAGFTVADRLITMLRQPEGMMQAILLQEVLKRPEERW